MQNLQQTVAAIREAALEDGRLPMAALVDRLGPRAWPVVLLVVTLPFITPVPTMGLSAPFGLAAAAIGWGLAQGRTPRLPRRVREAHLPPVLARGIQGAGELLARRLDGWVRPCLPRLMETRMAHAVSGGIIMVMGVLLALPLPIPFSNALPAWTILLVSASLLTRDGRLALVGWILAGFTAAAFAALGWLAWIGGAAAWQAW
jgi:hypothetical protein